MPNSAFMQQFERALGTEPWRVAITVAIVLASLVAYRVLFRSLSAWASRTDTPFDDEIVRLLRRPLSYLIPLVALTVAWPSASDASGHMSGGQHASLVLTILCCGWVATRLVRILDVALERQFGRTLSDDLQVRRVHTQLRGFRNIALFLIGLATTAAVLMTFETVRQFGVSLLASAGAAGVIIGFAAQRSISTIVAGIQIALSQPIRVDDVVIVEGEWGWIEEITLTYVVVRIWDLRRLVVPINYFIEKPFQNWTRNSAELLGTVYLYTDYTVDIEALRGELTRICENSPLWDRRVCGLVVTDAKQSVLELRALVSAQDSGKAWDLRCVVREGLVQFMQRNQPQSLPRFRVEDARLLAGSLKN
jgi:small-conductance mechanosensitive channel